MPPIDDWVAVEKATNCASMWIVVIDSAKRIGHALEAWVDGNSRAVDVVEDLREVRLKLFNGSNYLLVAFLELYSCTSAAGKGQ